MLSRAIRGASTLSVDTAPEMREVVVELLSQMLSENGVEIELISSIFFTATTDIHSIFPAAAARELELSQVPLMCAQELEIDGSLKMAIRVLMTVNTELKSSEIRHIYLRGASSLRPDLQSS
jgi:chorismate mutase